ncbi:carbon starvation protein A [Paratractidigestivibacter faecalis]|uniref:carbon starvation CstA family protein n=1 Tax=Paratractidigestivibacter faecalis TaxID=2292441 RepID=UPI002A919724|nr:carbon starvation CstA family protein [Paratractidigestivibacter faecalis]MCI5949937.1 carbon starvation protein A [Coriobacteriaceae bacterium]MCI6507109.1 carbon starvation protein A [Olsenella sp.]MDY6014326.1 carbon starvation CstA family protein [Paratractidigestivibacter faecalis]
MNGIVLMLVAAVVLACGYLLYGRWLSNKWGVDAKALTPARRMEDGKSFSPASAFTVFSHQFSSICGAGPVTGTIVAMAFGWLPVVLWVLIGGIFFGAVHDFGALYASMKNNGKSLAQLIEKYIGKTGRRLFLIFSWLFCIIVIAAFTSMVCGTFKYTPAEAGGIDFAKSYAAGCAGTISILFTFVAIAFGWAQRKFNLDGAKEFVVAVVAIVLMFAVGMQFPLYLDLNQWIAVVMVYLVFAGAMPIQTLKQPRDYLTTIMMVVMIVCAVLGIVVLGVNGQATITAPMFTGFSTKSGMMFPVLFVSVACGALSGFHSLVSSSTSSKQVSNETDAVKVGYGAMVLESFVGVLAIIIAGIMFSDMNTAGTGALNNGVASTPFQIFAAGIARGMKAFGVDGTVATVFMTMNVSALALTSLDAVARIARTSFSEFFAKSNDALAIEDKSGAMKVLGNPWFATLVTLIPGLALTFGGYLAIWPLFGASNQLLGGMTMITLAVFCKCTGRKGAMLYVPVAFLLCCTFTSLVQSIMGCVTALSAGTAASVFNSVLQLVFAILLVVLGLIVAVNCLRELFAKESGSLPDEEPEWSELGRKNCSVEAPETK